MSQKIYISNAVGSSQANNIVGNPMMLVATAMPYRREISKTKHGHKRPQKKHKTISKCGKQKQNHRT